MLQRTRRYATALAVLATVAVGNVPHGHAASHREAALVAQDPTADQTDTYSFMSGTGANRMLNIISNYIPLEEPGAGPNWYRLSDDIRYDINIENDATTVATVPVGGGVGIEAPNFSGRPNISYQFRFHTTYQDPKTILALGKDGTYGPVTNVGDAQQNERQTYTVSQLTTNSAHRQTFTDLTGGQTLLEPPNNIGVTTPLYNTDLTGHSGPIEGATTTTALDHYTQQSIYTLSNGIRVFVGPRLDAFYFDIDATFDLLNLRNPGVNSLKGYNCHTIAMQIPVGLVATGPVPVVGIYSSSNRSFYTTRPLPNPDPRVVASPGTRHTFGPFVQEARLANPGLNEVLIPAAVRDDWNLYPPSMDFKFQQYILHPELDALLTGVVGKPLANFEPRTDLQAVLQPDLLKVDTSTNAVPTEIDTGFSRLSLYGSDVVTSPYIASLGRGLTSVPSGWPNGRRLGDDVIDIALTLIANPLTTPNPATPNPFTPVGDNVDSGNPDNYVFPYMGAPANGRNHCHDPNNSGIANCGPS